jgi:hypothetical protein
MAGKSQENFIACCSSQDCQEMEKAFERWMMKKKANSWSKSCDGMDFRKKQKQDGPS